MNGITSYIKNQQAGNIEQKSLTLIRVKVEAPSQSSYAKADIADRADHPRNVIIADYSKV